MRGGGALSSSASLVFIIGLDGVVGSLFLFKLTDVF